MSAANLTPEQRALAAGIAGAVGMEQPHVVVGHSAAPWWPTETGVRSAAGYICHFNSVQRYADQDARFERETAEREADKLLVAAAPDLLAALRDVLAWGTDENYERAKASCDKARAAITRATGGGV